MSKTKKILLIANGTLLVLAIILGIYYWQHYFDNEQPPPGNGSITPPINGSTTPLTKPRIFLVTDQKVMAPYILPASNQIQYFDLTNYEIYAATFDGQTHAKIASPHFAVQELIKVIWAPGQNQLIAVFTDQDNQIKKYFYDVAANLSNILDSAIRSVAFSPNGGKIVFHYLNDQTNENLIAAAQPTGLNQNLLWQSLVRDWQVAWPALDKISLQTPASGLTGSSAYTINPETGEHELVFSNTLGLETLWSPNGEKLLFSKIVNSKQRLYLKTNNEIQELNTTGMASKCFWHDNLNLYCALSDSWPTNLTLPDDYYKGLVYLTDEIWHFDLENTKKTKVASQDEFDTTLDVGQILTSPDAKFLFVLNKKDNRLYGVRL